MSLSLSHFILSCCKNISLFLLAEKRSTVGNRLKSIFPSSPSSSANVLLLSSSLMPLIPMESAMLLFFSLLIVLFVAFSFPSESLRFASWTVLVHGSCCWCRWAERSPFPSSVFRPSFREKGFPASVSCLSFLSLCCICLFHSLGSRFSLQNVFYPFLSPDSSFERDSPDLFKWYLTLIEEAAQGRSRWWKRRAMLCNKRQTTR